MRNLNSILGAASLAAAAFLAACAGSGTASRDALGYHSIRGRVLFADGTYMDGATIELSHADGKGGFALVERVRTSFDGSYTIQSKHTGMHRIIASNDNDDFAIAATSEFEVAAGTGVIPIDFELAAAETVRAEGMLLDVDGRPLSLPELARLLPEFVGHDEQLGSAGADGVTEYFPFTAGSRLVARFDHRGIPPDGEPVASVSISEPGLGRFAVELPGTFEGQIVLEFRGRTVVALPWRNGDGLLEYLVDTQALFAMLGSLDVTLADPASAKDGATRLTAHRHGDVGESAIFTIENPPLPLRLVGVPDGDYTLVLETPAGSSVVGVTVVGANSTAVALPRLARATADVAIVDARAEADVKAGSTVADLLKVASLRTADGLPLPAHFELGTDSTRPSLRITDAPSCSAVLFLGGGLCRVELDAEKVATATLRLDPLERTEIRMRLFTGWEWKLPAAVPARLRLFDSTGVLVSDSKYTTSFTADGWVAATVDTPPGTYRAIFEVDDLRSIDEDLDSGMILVFPLE